MTPDTSPVTVKIRRPNGLDSISTKARIAVAVQAATAVLLVVLSGEVTVETLSPAISGLVTALLAFVVKDTVPDGTVVEYPEGTEVGI